MIQIQNLVKSYGKIDVLKSINMGFEMGKAYGIVGENGAGKTTLFRCFAGLESFSGEIDSPFDILKNHVGLMETNPYFLSRVTAKEHLQLICNARDILVKDFEERNIFDLPLNQYADTYSTGMKKKLALTALLLQNNDVLILDEPFNGVDIHSNMVILEMIKKWKNAGKTLFISSHIFSTLEETCHEIHLLKEGEFVQRVRKDQFRELDKQMRDFMIGDRLKNMKI
ncbi:MULTISPECIES: ABC transporter ATP-binding protein [unclassified Lentimicrobium]|uniref:ATP-binding cassette domain-containing protein n=1 Tax=unclassified Lentimicrobium TaxID=2677434 RepID=UPI0015531893|nr:MULTISPECIES: ABC transporter ATP-binding protein [unclassified Lentimicrobium]NPD46121.1 ABC transporter ATP-binding protein [Lentimicrobium sp. S6]NPD86471.1 ABC transporter ATP-binding protein [Lentimicrobium sp. L6]